MRRKIGVLTGVLALLLLGLLGLSMFRGGADQTEPTELETLRKGAAATQRARQDTQGGRSCVVRGCIKRRRTSEAEVGLRVELTHESGESPRTMTVSTDDSGEFVFSPVAAGGSFTLRVVAERAASIEITDLTLADGEARDLGTLWLEPVATLTIEVRSGNDDQPVPGARVALYRSSETRPWDYTESRAPEPVRVLTSSAQGSAVFEQVPEGVWTVAVEKSGHARGRTLPIELLAAGGERVVTVHLGKGYALEGTVRDGRGTPLPDAVVVVSGARTLTDAGGRYRIDTLASGETSIWGGRDGAPLRAFGRLEIPAIAHYDFVIDVGGPLTGRVLDAATGEPVAGANVTAQTRIFDVRDRVLADAEGRFQFDRLPECSIAYLSASKDGYRSAGQHELTADVTLVRFPRVSHPTIPGRRVWSIPLREGVPVVHDLLLTRAAARATSGVKDADSQTAPADVRGRVVDESGAPIAAAHVAALLDDGNRHHSTTELDGTFRLADLPSGQRARLSAWKRGFAPRDAAAEETDIGADAGDIELHLAAVEPLVVTGTVRSAAGRRLENAYVQVVVIDGRIDYRQGPLGAWTMWQQAQRAPVAVDGSYRVELPSRGRFVVRAAAEGHAAFAAAPIDPPPTGDAPQPPITLEAGESLRGRVTNADTGAPIVSARLKLAGGPPGTVSRFWSLVGTTDGTGAFRAEGLPAGRYAVRAESPGRASVSLVVTLPSTEDVVFRLGPERTISGSVLREDGRPAAALWLATGKLTAVVDDRGVFELRGLAEGDPEIEIAADPAPGVGRPPASILTGGSAVPAGAQDVRLRALVGRLLKGVVAGQDGSAVFGAIISVQHSGARTREARSDASGQFTVHGLRDGECRVTVSATGFRSKELSVTLHDEASVRVELESTPTIHGTLLSKSGQPLGLARLRLRDGTGAVVATGRTALDGRFRLPVADAHSGNALTLQVGRGASEWLDVGTVSPGVPAGELRLR